MRLLSNGRSTGATSFAGISSAQDNSYKGGGASHRLEIVQITGGSSVASTVGYLLRYGPSSNGDATTVILCGSDSSVMNFRSEDLGIVANWFELIAPSTAANGHFGLVFGQ